MFQLAALTIVSVLKPCGKLTHHFQNRIDFENGPVENLVTSSGTH
jgi:hypothetical protein